MSLDLSHSSHLFVANLKDVSLEKLITSKLSVFFNEQESSESTQVQQLYKHIMEPVEKALIQESLKANRGNQVRTARMLGINRNTLKKKLDLYSISPKL